ncbi:hypothetical protein L2E82_15643 [Cichorium intybus]|uniref:Uncharacterized protein n=1 Tax=Cichorium intybus TaxID=13427 RepID=A0ACB9F3X8_CICIN|nr:hypothetical protein L2E82_15643 [Cichorium intybus]
MISSSLGYGKFDFYPKIDFSFHKGYPMSTSGREASIVAEVVEVEENSTDHNMRTVRDPPVITVNKSAAYAQYQLTYIRDVPYKPEELYVKTRNCEPDAGANIVQYCERQVVPLVLVVEVGAIARSVIPIALNGCQKGCWGLNMRLLQRYAAEVSFTLNGPYDLITLIASLP